MTRDYRPLPAPSWPKVIATTLRLWAQRRVFRTRANAAASRRRYGRFGVALLALAAIAGAATSVALAEAQSAAQPAATHGASTSPRSGGTSSPIDSAALAAASVTRQAAATWVAAQVDHGAIVACDPLMCSDLLQQGFPAEDLSAIVAATGDPLGSGVVVSTPAVRSQLGTRLAQVYAPVVIASFGSGPDLIQVRVSAVGGSAAYLSALQSDLHARMFAGRTLAGNRNIHAPAMAKNELAAGQVDSRLQITLAALAHKFPVQIRDFSDAGPGDGMTGELRRLTVFAPTARYLQQLLTFLNAQRPPLRATVTERHFGRITVVHIEFTAPSLPGLLNVTAQQ